MTWKLFFKIMSSFCIFKQLIMNISIETHNSDTTKGANNIET